MVRSSRKRPARYLVDDSDGECFMNLRLSRWEYTKFSARSFSYSNPSVSRWVNSLRKGFFLRSCSRWLLMLG